MDVALAGSSEEAPDVIIKVILTCGLDSRKSVSRGSFAMYGNAVIDWLEFTSVTLHRDMVDRGRVRDIVRLYEATEV